MMLLYMSIEIKKNKELILDIHEFTCDNNPLAHLNSFSSENFLHSEALMWEISFVKDLVSCRYEEISTAVSVEAGRSDTLFS